MKFSKLICAAAGALMLGTVSAAPISAAPANNAGSRSADGITMIKKGDVQISSPEGAALHIYPGDSSAISRVLPAGSKWRVLGEFYRESSLGKEYGSLWYELGSDQWVSASDCAISETFQYPPFTIGAGAKIIDTEPLTGVATVTYRTPIVVWARPGAAPTKRYLPRFSSWKYFKVATTEDGENWYNLGGNQWIPEKYVDYGQDPHIAFLAPIIKKGAIATVDERDTRIYYGNESPFDTLTRRVLPVGSRWRVFDSKNYGVPMYNLGGHQWVRADQVSLSN